MLLSEWQRALVLVCLCLAVLGQTSCLHSRRVITQKVAPHADPALARELLGLIAEQYRAVSDFKATVLLSVTLGKPNRSNFKRYPGIRGYILLRKPADIRIMGLAPMMGSRIFDMVSNGDSFRLSVPSKNRFVVGRDEVTTLSRDKLENIRPRHLQEVIVPKPLDPATETATVEEPVKGDGYTLRLARSSPGGNSRPSRTVWIDGATLHVAREVIFSSAGATLTEAQYSQWRQTDGVIFPMRIEIDRPQEEYHLVIQIQAIEINRGLSNEMFVLEQPPGAQRVVLSDPGSPPQHDDDHSR
jgi:outer membrane lipoprotein-sorting protein